MKKRDLYYERIPTKLLREDISLLGTFLGRVIKDQEGLAFFKIVEKLRLLSKNTFLGSAPFPGTVYLGLLNFLNNSCLHSDDLPVLDSPTNNIFN